MVRADGFNWYPGGIEHGFACRAFDDEATDVTDICTTDGEAARCGLRVLDDDRHSIRECRAVALVQTVLPPVHAKVAIGTAENSNVEDQVVEPISRIDVWRM